MKPWQWCGCILPTTGGGKLSSPSVSYYLSFEMQPVIAPFETLFLKQCVTVVFQLGSSSEHREGSGAPLHYPCLENPVDEGAWWAAVHGVTKGRTQLSDFTFTH